MNFCLDELLQLRIFYISTLYHTNICIQTLAYELLHIYFFQTNFIPYEHLLTNNCIRTLCICTTCIRTLVLESSHVFLYPIILFPKWPYSNVWTRSVTRICFLHKLLTHHLSITKPGQSITIYPFYLHSICISSILHLSYTFHLPHHPILSFTLFC